MQNNNNWRYNNGVLINNVGLYLGSSATQAQKDRLQDVLAQCKANKCFDIQKAIDSELARLLGNGKQTNESKVRYTLLCHAQRVMILTYSYKNSYSDIKACVQAGTPVYVYSPYATPDLVRVTSIDQLNELCNEQKESNKSFGKEQEYLNQFNELNNQLIYVLNQPCTWLGSQYTMLHKLMKEFPNLEAFMLYVNAIIDSIEEEGEWDLEVTSTVVLNQKASVYTYVATSGENKGLRVTGSSTKFDTWENHEVLIADILKKFLSLTFYKSVGIKPLKKVMTNGVDYIPVCNTDDLPETEFYSTPFYVDEN